MRSQYSLLYSAPSLGAQWRLSQDRSEDGEQRSQGADAQGLLRDRELSCVGATRGVSSVEPRRIAFAHRPDLSRQRVDALATIICGKMICIEQMLHPAELRGGCVAERAGFKMRDFEPAILKQQANFMGRVFAGVPRIGTVLDVRREQHGVAALQTSLNRAQSEATFGVVSKQYSAGAQDSMNLFHHEHRIVRQMLQQFAAKDG